MITGLLTHFKYSLEYLSDFEELLLCLFFFVWESVTYFPSPTHQITYHQNHCISMKKIRSTMVKQVACITDITVRKMF